MLLYGIDDIRYFYQNDLRFLKQFRVKYRSQNRPPCFLQK